MNPLDVVSPDLTDPQSVEANRRGELTPAQQARLANPLSVLIGTAGPGILGLNLLMDNSSKHRTNGGVAIAI